jgi:hypothetical protein
MVGAAAFWLAERGEFLEGQRIGGLDWYEAGDGRFSILPGERQEGKIAS